MEMTMALLGHLTPLHGGDAIPLAAPVLTIGRADECDVTISHRSISSRHCRLTFRDGIWIVEDLGSKNGTFVGREPCKRARLQSGAVLRIGAIRFELTAPSVQSVSPVASGDENLAMELLSGSAESASPAQAVTRPHTPGSAAGRGRRSRPVSKAERPRRSATTAEQGQARPRAASVPQSRAKKVAGPKTSPARPVRSGKRFLGKLTPHAGGDPIALMEEVIVLGRGHDCGIRLKYSTVSTEHCRLSFRDGYWSVCDLGSRNGIRINGQPATEDWLMPGDILSLGKLRFEIDYQPKSDELPPEFDVTGGKSLLEKAGLEKVLESEANPSWLVTDQDPEPEQRIDLESL